ncbi:MAG: MBL fold metallo-hydrolase [Verrucomicrobiales bacterium]
MNFRSPHRMLFFGGGMLLITGAAALGQETPPLPEGWYFSPGAINRIQINLKEGKLAFYGHPEDSNQGPPCKVYLTHNRRDIVETARGAVEQGASLVAPSGLVDALGKAEEFWQTWWEKRFDYYQQQVTRLPVRSLPVKLAVAGGETEEIGQVKITVLDTPGYTRDAVTYLLESDGKRYAFCGDLMMAGGKVPDFYSFQDEIREAKIGGYHGYGARFGPWIASLQKLAAAKPDVVIPARGPMSKDVAGDTSRLINGIRAAYHNYLSTNALTWYFKEERMRICGERVLGKGAAIDLMPYCEHVDLPPWCQHIGTTKLLVSNDGYGFALDCGGAPALKSLQQAVSDGLVKSMEGLFVTHVHNDHTAAVAEAAAALQCPVYAVPEVGEVLENPGAWFLPGVTAKAVPEVVTQPDGSTMDWRGFHFTFRFFPGQMWNHGALLVERPDHKPVFFIGDSFAPSGIDDYCMMNRNLMRPDTGFLSCFRQLRQLPEGSWLVNQHIPHLFRFTAKELDGLENRYLKRAEILSALVPWDDVNYAIDEQWASLFPYGQEAKVGSKLRIEARLWNHSQTDRTFSVRLHLPSGWSGSANTQEVRIDARERGKATFEVVLPEDCKPGITVLTADILSGPDIEQKEFCESLVKILP